MKKALFLDRDGIVNKLVKKHSKSYKKVMDDSPFNLSEFEFNEDVKELLNFAKERGYLPLIVTNQPSILKESQPMRDYEEINSRICKYLNMGRSQIFECFHKENFSLECLCRKPKPGLFLMAKGLFDVDLEKSAMIGDSYTDILAAYNAGIKRKIFLIREPSDKNIGNFESKDELYKEKRFQAITIKDLKEVIEKELI